VIIMDEAAGGRVIVNVDSSLSGLRALREAIAQARLRGIPVLAVRAYPKPRTDGISSRLWAANDLRGSGAFYVASKRAETELHRQWMVSERQTTAAMEQAFEQAMGGIPRDVRVRLAAVPGHLAPTLVSMANRDEDLIVVPMVQRGRLHWTRAALPRYCTARARCAVLVVPPHELAREFGGSWHLRPRRLHKITSDFPPPSNDMTRP
jgi:nucleotide-binding universal stress UspA family protein